LLSHLLVGAYAIAAALTIVAFWSQQGGKQETDLKNSASRSHLAAELVTAAILTVGGLGLLLAASWASLTTGVGLGMLGYAGLNITGKYVGERNKAMVIVLIVEELLSLVGILTLLSNL